MEIKEIKIQNTKIKRTIKTLNNRLNNQINKYRELEKAHIRLSIRYEKLKELSEKKNVESK